MNTTKEEWWVPLVKSTVEKLTEAIVESIKTPKPKPEPETEQTIRVEAADIKVQSGEVPVDKDVFVIDLNKCTFVIKGEKD
jgi:hypothetical protein